MNQYINPFTDTGFKLIFGQHKELLISFLNCLLKGERVIVDLTYMDKEQVNDDYDGRGIIYDIFCKTDTGEYVIVEMQNQRRENFINRTVFYAAKAICRQAVKGNDWNYDIKAVYCIAFMNFTYDMFGDQLCSSARLTIDRSSKQLTPILRFFYIQIPKSKEQDEECVVTSLESWIYVLKNMEVLNHPRYSDNKIFDRLKKITDMASLSPEERDCYERDLKRYRDALSLDLTYEHILEKARLSDEKLRAATKELKAQDKKLKAQGDQLKAQGESILNGARKMKSVGIPSEEISRIFNIPIEQIEKL